MRVVGWYDNAQVFAEPQTLKRNTARGQWTYQFKTEVKDAHLLPSAEQFLEVPMRVKRTDKGFIGQRNWFFPEGSYQYQEFMQAFGLLRVGKWDRRPRNYTDQKTFEEGQRQVTEITITVRNPQLVKAAKAHYGYRCQVCGFNFEEQYGEIGKGFIEVHHLAAMSARQGQSVTSVSDVRVLCANCHRMIYRKPTPLALDELKRMLRN